MGKMMAITITHDSANHQFVTTVDGKKAYLRYEIQEQGKTLDYYSTFVPPELRGQKIGEQLVKFALEYAKENQLRVLPTCPFVKKFMTHS